MSCTCCNWCGVERGADYPREGFRKWRGDDICLDCLRQIPEYAEGVERQRDEARKLVRLLVSSGLARAYDNDSVVRELTQAAAEWDKEQA